MERRKLFFHCYDHNHPVGGQKDTYRHVDALNELGLDAYVVHQQAGYCLDWFENSTRVIDHETFTRVFDIRNDYIVVPEDLGMEILNYPGRKVIFNKSVWRGFCVFGLPQPARMPYCAPDVVAVLVVSDHNADVLKYAYPHLPVLKVQPHIDETLFSFKPLMNRKKQIIFVPKAPISTLTLYHILHARAASRLNALDSWSWINLSDKSMSERDVAQLLQESLLLVFFSAEEGLGRIMLEAMASGCLVVAFKNGTVQEIVPPEMQFDWGDLIGVASFIERLALFTTESIDEFTRLAQKALLAAATYSSEKYKASIASAWNEIFRITARNDPQVLL